LERGRGPIDRDRCPIKKVCCDYNVSKERKGFKGPGKGKFLFTALAGNFPLGGEELAEGKRRKGGGRRVEGLRGGGGAAPRGGI